MYRFWSRDTQSTHRHSFPAFSWAESRKANAKCAGRRVERENLSQKLLLYKAKAAAFRRQPYLAVSTRNLGYRRGQTPRSSSSSSFSACVMFIEVYSNQGNQGYMTGLFSLIELFRTSTQATTLLPALLMLKQTWVLGSVFIYKPFMYFQLFWVCGSYFSSDSPQFHYKYLIARPLLPGWCLIWSWSISEAFN